MVQNVLSYLSCTVHLVFSLFRVEQEDRNKYKLRSRKEN